MRHDDFGDRMKCYEQAARTALPLRMPVILRVDGRAFHTLTAKCARPFDFFVSATMDATAIALCEEIQGAVFAYVQSDEITVLIHNYKRLNSGAWFGNEVQKMVSVSASIATRAFNAAAPEALRRATFDSRVFVVPEAEVANVFVWRQKDAQRNAVQMIARSHFSHRECDRKSCRELVAMLEARGVSLDAYPLGDRRGRSVYRVPDEYTVDGMLCRWQVNRAMPLIQEDRAHVEKWLAVEAEEAA